MRKVIAAINMTLDGNCDHTAVNADAEIHEHYSELLRNAGIILYGRITYELMEFWPPLVKNPSGDKAMDEFAVIMDKVPKLVFSKTFTTLDWATASLATTDPAQEVNKLKQQPGNDIYVGSRSIIIQLLNLNLIDELQLCIHPVIAGKGLQLFENANGRKDLTLVKTKAFTAGAMIFYYEPVKP